MGVRTALFRSLASQLGRPRGLYGRLVARMLNKGNRDAITAAVDALAPTPTDTVADLGFGGGLGLGLLIERAGLVHGIDYSPSMVERAARRFHSGKLRLHTGSMTALPLADAELDGLITLNTIYFIEDVALAFTEMTRVLRPGGRAVIGLMDPAAMAGLPVVEHGFRVRPVAEVIDTLAGAGLDLVDHREIGRHGGAYHLLVVQRA
ncbi:methyltransferase [Alloactinosynnema sp. L-07]|uniref:class I SAM-dependent methyltransferase n=1 Tax=Alloactinosynnema sp. L-07 TaxID=1653480 RepID=UPI00065EF3EC|nr:class I SAM-dependent methyltransferase [Alloactinosynnema sp. L-07]CRK56312.1 methyltransferase [Alloactinosynnema sp. L-07]